jgi:predicted ATP-dependent Lon-type protease
MNKKVEVFIEYWEKKISEIKTNPITPDGATTIRAHLTREWIYLQVDLTEEEIDAHLESYHTIQSNLEVTLQIAQTEYKLKNRSILARIIKSIADIAKSITDIFNRHLPIS